MIRSNTARTLSQLLAITVTVLLIGVLYLAKTVIFPLALALLLTFMLAPVVTWLERLRMPRIPAVFVVMLAAGAILTAIGWVVFTQLIAVADEFPAYTLNVQNKIESFRESKTTKFTRAQEEVNRLSQQFQALSSDAAKKRAHVTKEELGATPDHPLAVQNVGSSPGRLAALSGALGMLLTVLLVVVFTFFMLIHREDLRNRFIRLTGHEHLNVMTQAMDDASNRVSRYLSLQLLVNASFGTIIAIALQLLGLPHAMLWGFLACLLRFIPYVGAPIAAALPTALSIAVFDGWTKTLLIMALFFCMEVMTGNVLEPHIYGRYTGLSSLAILIAAIFWALIWGPVGLVLSVPLTVCLVVMGSHVPRLEFLTVLLGDQPVMPPDAHYYQRLLATDAEEARRVLETFLKDGNLRDLYDTVIIPALNLAEQDRHRNVLDEPTVAFITQTTKELVEELNLRSDEAEQPGTSPESVVKNAVDVEPSPLQTPSEVKRIVVIPVRDDADEIIAIMAAQMLQRGGYEARAIPIGTVDGMIGDAFKTQPDVVCLSALPPYAIAHARNLYRKLRAQDRDLKIIVGLWHFTDDPVKAANEISGGELGQVAINMVQITLQAGLALRLPIEQLGTSSPPTAIASPSSAS